MRITVKKIQDTYTHKLIKLHIDAIVDLYLEENEDINVSRRLFTPHYYTEFTDGSIIELKWLKPLEK